MDLLKLRRTFNPPQDNRDEGGGHTDDELARVKCRDRIVEVEEVDQEIRSFRSYIPVHDFTGVGRGVDSENLDGTTLPKQLAKSLGLTHLPQTHDLQTKRGIRATYGIAYRPRDNKSSERFFFIREEILQTLLRKRGFGLVRAVWGERRLSTKKKERIGSEAGRGGPTYTVFQAIHCG